jgi:hypothetical protein
MTEEKNQERPILKSIAKDLVLSKYAHAIPVFGVPAIDETQGSGVKKVYMSIDEEKQLIEVTVVFGDEIRPDCVTNCMYGSMRRVLFGRYEDVETFFIKLDGNSNISSVSFDGTYAGNQEWFTSVPKHGSEEVGMDLFDKHQDTKRPVIWINTWNHMFAETNSNSTMGCVILTDFNVSVGDRAHVDSKYHGMITSFHNPEYHEALKIKRGEERVSKMAEARDSRLNASSNNKELEMSPSTGEGVPLTSESEDPIPNGQTVFSSPKEQGKLSAPNEQEESQEDSRLLSTADVELQNLAP